MTYYICEDCNDEMDEEEALDGCCPWCDMPMMKDTEDPDEEPEES